jgi:hypothetical protein
LAQNGGDGMESEPDGPRARGLRRYVRLVTEALGLSGECSWVQAEPPGSVYLALEGRLPSFPDHDVALLWDEEHGWAAAVETHSGTDLVVVSYHGEDVLPPPREVATFVTRLFRGECPGQPSPTRLSGDDLGRRLSGYALTLLMPYSNTA